MNTTHLKTDIDFKKELNAAQYEAVIHTEGPCLCIAGAGSGKTRTLVYRVAYLVGQGIDPSSILLLTFTRKASEEMLRRATALLDNRCDRVAGGTFHSFANAILRRYARLLEFPSNFTILDRTDAEDVVNLIRGRLDIDTKSKRFPKKDAIIDMISSSQNKSISIAEYVELEYPQYAQVIDSIQEINNMYHTYKRKNFLMDYDDLLIYLKQLLETQPSVREALMNEYKYIMVDEYQDTNRIQGDIVYLLGSAHANVMAVGDDSQSIYSFRGAHFKNIIQFPKLYPGCRIIKLEENYRSTQPILNFTNGIIEQAQEKYAKDLFTSKKGGIKPKVICIPDEHAQSEYVAQRILELREEGVELSEIAVLFRAGFLSFDLEIELQKRNIPFVKRGGFKFIETAHIKDTLAYLRVADNPHDVVSWSRILSLVEKVGDKTVQKIIDTFAHKGYSQEVLINEFQDKPGLVDLGIFLNNIYSKQLTPAELTGAIVDFYEPILLKHYPDDFQKRKKDLDHFKTIAARFTSLRQLLTDMALEPPSASIAAFSPTDKEDELLVLSTVHSAKGLEWHTVLIIWALDGRFPSLQSMGNDAELEEERRLMYVATTRAKENLIITYPINAFDQSTGLVFSQPSRFIEDIHPALYDKDEVVVEQKSKIPWFFD